MLADTAIVAYRMFCGYKGGSVHCASLLSASSLAKSP